MARPLGSLPATRYGLPATSSRSILLPSRLMTPLGYYYVEINSWLIGWFQRITEMAGVVLSLDPKPIQVSTEKEVSKLLTVSESDD